jgi:hypothetical protein
MSREVRHAIVLVLALGLLLGGCEGGLTFMGSSERSNLAGQSGWMEIKARSVNGSAVRDLDLTWPNARVPTRVALEVGEGSLAIELLDGDDNVTLSLEATAGSPASGEGYVDTDWDGEASYRLTATEAKNVVIRFDFGAQ